MQRRSLRNRTALTGCAALAVIAGLSGCGPTEQERFRDLVRQSNQLKVDKILLQEQLAGRDTTITELENQLQNLRDRGLAPPAPVFDVDHLQILDITSGTDLDGLPGDDAVTVYFRPIDHDGDVLKRAGEIKITLLDNLAGGQPTVLGFRVDNHPLQIRKAWYGKFWTNHYKISVPFFPDAHLKPGQEVDIHISFEDFATGRTFTARKAVKINRVTPDENQGR